MNVSHHARYLLMALLCLSLAACASTARARGDRAFEEKRYSDALTQYDRLIEEGSKDPELFFKSAQAAMFLGDFGAAERYFSRSIRYGGGLEVMHALAEFYILTSNYARAAQVLYELLKLDPNPQKIYTNLGLALLYSGSYHEAESMLLIAQQMDPKAPGPYINLGLLYERHFRALERGVAFYSCYLTLTEEGAPQRAEVAQRVQELRGRIGMNAMESLTISCGEPYVPGDYSTHDDAARRAKLDALKMRSYQEDLNFKDTPAQEGPPQVTIETADPTAVIVDEPALRALHARNACAEVLAAPGVTRVELWSSDALRMIADCHMQLNQRAPAERVWRHLIEREPNAGDLLALFDLLDDPSQRAEVRALCAQYSSLLTHPSLRKRCATKE